MARLAYCRTCKATYPLVIVNHEGGRSTKVKEPSCPMGHTDVHEIEAPARKPALGKSAPKRVVAKAAAVKAPAKKAAAVKAPVKKAAAVKPPVKKAAAVKATAKKPAAAKAAAKKPAAKKKSDKKA